ncbi:MAG: ribosome silencing factor [Dethiobacter sp.]|jgi:ribosome-associated protein|nr:ribosome silencing factor [Dethiobacter sp.]
MAHLAARLAADKKAIDPVLLEVGKVSVVADYFLIATGNSAAQVHTICDHLLDNMKEAGFSLLRIEGYREGWWVVLDYSALIIHLFQPEAREFYDLERLWSKAPVYRMQETRS